MFVTTKTKLRGVYSWESQAALAEMSGPSCPHLSTSFRSSGGGGHRACLEILSLPPVLGLSCLLILILLPISGSKPLLQAPQSNSEAPVSPNYFGSVPVTAKTKKRIYQLHPTPCTDDMFCWKTTKTQKTTRCFMLKKESWTVSWPDSQIFTVEHVMFIVVFMVIIWWR